MGRVFTITHTDANAAGNIVEGTVSICSKDVKVLFDPRLTHSFLSPALAKIIVVHALDLPCVNSSYM